MSLAEILGSTEMHPDTILMCVCQLFMCFFLAFWFVFIWLTTVVDHVFKVYEVYENLKLSDGSISFIKVAKQQKLARNICLLIVVLIVALTIFVLMAGSTLKVVSGIS